MQLEKISQINKAFDVLQKAKKKVKSDYNRFISDGSEITILKRNKGSESESNTNISSLKDLSLKLKIPISKLQNQYDIGMKVEKEHSESEAETKKLVMDHLKENPEYYTQSKPKNWGIKEIKKGLNNIKNFFFFFKRKSKRRIFKTTRP